MHRLKEALHFRKEQIVRNNEITKDMYLQKLSESDRACVGEFTKAIDVGMERVPKGIDVGVLVFGSSVKQFDPKFDHSQGVGDIDIRLVSSAPARSSLQDDVRETLVNIVREYAESVGEEEDGYEFNPSYTEHVIQVKAITYDDQGSKRDIISPFLDYNNDDPSFQIANRFDGIPLHISISGGYEDTLSSHLQEEAKQKQYFSVLGIFPGKGLQQPS